MKTKFFTALLFLILLNACCVFAAINVPLEVKNDLTVNRNDMIFTAGAPIPIAENITDVSDLNVYSNDGKAIPSQIKATARWGGAPNDTGKPLKWVLVTFSGSVSAASSKTFYLKSGAKNNTQSGITIENLADTMKINTNKAQFVINKKNFSLFESVIVDGEIITNSNENGFFLTDDSGKVYSSANGSPQSLTIEEHGPLMAIIKAEGSLTDSTQKALTDYRMYIYFYANTSYARVLYTIGNHNVAALNGTRYQVYNFYEPNSITFRELSAKFNLSNVSGGFSYLFPSQNSNKTGILNNLNIYQDSSGKPYWNRYDSSDNPRPNSYVSFKGYKATDASNIIDSGNQFSGWFDISDSKKGISMGMTDFWQNFPKSLSGSSDGFVKLNIFPKDYAGLYNFRVGEEKTTDMFIYFHKGDAASSNANEIAASLSSPVIAFAPSEWYADSKAIQEFTTATGSLEGRYGQINSANNEILYDYFNDRTIIADPNYTGPDGDYYPYYSLWQSLSDQKPGGLDYFDFYGWAWYGDQPLDFEVFAEGKAGPFIVKYDFDYGAWLQFFRTGDKRWRDMAKSMANHLELIMLHDISTETGWSVSILRNAVFGMSAHLEPGNTNTVRNMLGPVMEVAYGARGALLDYYLTGNPINKRFIDKAAGYACNMIIEDSGYYKNQPYLRDSGASGTWGARPLANYINILNEGWKATGDMRYQKAIQDVIEYFPPEKQPFINGPVAGNTDFIAAPFLMMYVNAVSRYAVIAEEYGLTSQSAMAKAQVIKFMDWFAKYGVIKPKGYYSSWWHYYYNGLQNNGTSQANQDEFTDMINNWMLVIADSFAYAYSFSSDPSYIKYAEEYFRTGITYPFYYLGARTYSAVKEAVNHAANGHVYLYYKALYDSLPHDAVLPAITINNPVSNSSVSGIIDILVIATDNVGVQKVIYYINSGVLATVSASPFSHKLDTTTMSNGTYTLIAEAYDFSGNKGASNEVSFNINNIFDATPPDCSIIKPISGETMSGIFDFEVNATDDTGVQKVEFYIDGKLIQTLNNTSSYLIKPDSKTYSEGEHNLGAISYDTYSNKTLCQDVSVKFDNTNSAPVADIYYDRNVIYQPDSVINFDASKSSDPDGDFLSYQWNFGDGSVADGVKAIHAYLKQGEYIVELTVSDGKTSTKKQTKFNVYPAGIIYQTNLQDGLQDAFIRASYEGNYGDTDVLQVYNGGAPDYRTLMKYDVTKSQIPANASIIGAILRLNCTKVQDNAGDQAILKNQIYALNQDWKEGKGTYGNTMDGATWQTYDGQNKWKTPGGDFDLATDFGFGASGIVAETNPAVGEITFDITALFRKWVSGEMPNNGFAIVMPGTNYYSQATFTAKESSNQSLRPSLSISYLIPDNPVSANLVKNPGADENLKYWDVSYGNISVESADSKNHFVLKAGYVFQDIDISNIDGIYSGTKQLAVSANMKAEIANADTGNPSIYGYIIGKENDPEGINTHISTPVVKSDVWTKRTASYVMPKYSKKVRVFMQKSDINGANTINNKAYFDDIFIEVN